MKKFTPEELQMLGAIRKAVKHIASKELWADRALVIVETEIERTSPGQYFASEVGEFGVSAIELWGEVKGWLERKGRRQVFP